MLSRLIYEKGEMMRVVTTVEQAKTGNKMAMETLLKSVYPELYKTAFIYVKNESDALDIVQDSIEKIIKQLGTLKSEKYFKTWATRIAIFTSLDFLKKANRQDVELLVEIKEKDIIPLDDKLDMFTAIHKLPEDLQEITLLFYFHEFKIDEISEIMTIPVGTIKYKLHTIRQLLRAFLEGGKDNDLE